MKCQKTSVERVISEMNLWKAQSWLFFPFVTSNNFKVLCTVDGFFFCSSKVGFFFCSLLAVKTFVLTTLQACFDCAKVPIINFGHFWVENKTKVGSSHKQTRCRMEEGHPKTIIWKKLAPLWCNSMKKCEKNGCGKNLWNCCQVFKLGMTKFCHPPLGEAFPFQKWQFLLLKESTLFGNFTLTKWMEKGLSRRLTTAFFFLDPLFKVWKKTRALGFRRVSDVWAGLADHFLLVTGLAWLAAVALVLKVDRKERIKWFHRAKRRGKRKKLI